MRCALVGALLWAGRSRIFSEKDEDTGPNDRIRRLQSDAPTFFFHDRRTIQPEQSQSVRRTHTSSMPAGVICRISGKGYDNTHRFSGIHRANKLKKQKAVLRISSLPPDPQGRLTNPGHDSPAGIQIVKERKTCCLKRAVQSYASSCLIVIPMIRAPLPDRRDTGIQHPEGISPVQVHFEHL